MSQYMQEPCPEGGTLIKKTWFPQYKDVPADLTNFRITADTAVSAKKTSDNSVFLLTAENKQHDLFVLDLVKGKWEMPQLIQNALNFVAKFKLNYPKALFKGLYIEYKQSGQGLIQTLKQNTRLPVIDVVPKGDKVLRVQQCLPYMQSHRIHVPESAHWVSEFMDELGRFTPTMKHKHDDQVDALVYAIFDAYIDCKIARVSNYYY
jgi:predicted phage terminase large subunit-like protein